MVPSIKVSELPTFPSLPESVRPHRQHVQPEQQIRHDVRHDRGPDVARPDRHQAVRQPREDAGQPAVVLEAEADGDREQDRPAQRAEVDFRELFPDQPAVGQAAPEEFLDRRRSPRPSRRAGPARAASRRLQGRKGRRSAARAFSRAAGPPSGNRNPGAPAIARPRNFRAEPRPRTPRHRPRTPAAGSGSADARTSTRDTATRTARGRRRFAARSSMPAAGPAPPSGQATPRKAAHGPRRRRPPFCCL